MNTLSASVVHLCLLLTIAPTSSARKIKINSQIKTSDWKQELLGHLSENVVPGENDPPTIPSPVPSYLPSGNTSPPDHPHLHPMQPKVPSPVRKNNPKMVATPQPPTPTPKPSPIPNGFNANNTKPIMTISPIEQDSNVSLTQQGSNFSFISRPNSTVKNDLFQ